MIKDRTTTAGELNFSMVKSKSIDSVIQFLDEKLPQYLRDRDDRFVQEDDISQDCCIYLNREVRDKLFMFHFQYKYFKSKRSSDLSIISTERFDSKDPLFVIEAKRLPTPGSGRQREYVQGSLGAMERFKRAHHGSKLFKSAIIGYVQKNTFSHWEKEIRQWINDLIQNNDDSSITWTTADLLIFLASFGGVNKYLSQNTRQKLPDIELHHYWLSMSNQ